MLLLFLLGANGGGWSGVGVGDEGGGCSGLVSRSGQEDV